jgi:glucan phosphoethanolaminetransferase (alkaline phosphatase superfamily)
MEFTPPLKYLIRQSLRRYASLMLITIGLIILVRFYEILFIFGKAGYPSGSTLNLLVGIRFDLMLALRLSVIMLIPFLLIDHFQQKVARLLFVFVSIAVVLTEVALLEYFSSAGMPLGPEILSHSMNEIQGIILSSRALNQYTLAPLFIFLLISVYAFYKWARTKVSSVVWVLLIMAMFFSLLPFNSINPSPTKFKNEFRKNISANKFSLFCESLLSYYQQKYAPVKFEGNDSVNFQLDIEPDQIRLPNFDEKLIEANDTASKPDGSSAVFTDKSINPHKDSLKIKQK